MDDTLETSLGRRALDRALATRGDVQGAIHHSDRGSQYARRAHRDRIAKAGRVARMSRRGDVWDQAFAERFFGTLEQKLVREAPWTGLSAALRGWLERSWHCGARATLRRSDSCVWHHPHPRRRSSSPSKPSPRRPQAPERPTGA